MLKKMTPALVSRHRSQKLTDFVRGIHTASAPVATRCTRLSMSDTASLSTNRLPCHLQISKKKSHSLRMVHGMARQHTFLRCNNENNNQLLQQLISLPLVDNPSKDSLHLSYGKTFHIRVFSDETADSIPKDLILMSNKKLQQLHGCHFIAWYDHPHDTDITPPPRDAVSASQTAAHSANGAHCNSIGLEQSSPVS